jgi:hypothetical protein
MIIRPYRKETWQLPSPTIPPNRSRRPQVSGPAHSFGAAAEPALRINHDLHTHTIYSDGASTIPLHVLEARAFELEAVAITDHYTPGSKIAESEAEFNRYLAEIERERSNQQDVIVIKGAEATAWTPPAASVSTRARAKLEWVLCAI